MNRALGCRNGLQLRCSQCCRVGVERADADGRCAVKRWLTGAGSNREEQVPRRCTENTECSLKIAPFSSPQSKGGGMRRLPGPSCNCGGACRLAGLQGGRRSHFSSRSRLIGRACSSPRPASRRNAHGAAAIETRGLARSGLCVRGAFPLLSG